MDGNQTWRPKREYEAGLMLNFMLLDPLVLECHCPCSYVHPIFCIPICCPALVATAISAGVAHPFSEGSSVNPLRCIGSVCA